VPSFLALRSIRCDCPGSSFPPRSSSGCLISDSRSVTTLEAARDPMWTERCWRYGESRISVVSTEVLIQFSSCSDPNRADLQFGARLPHGKRQLTNENATASADVMTLNPETPDFEARLRESFARQRVMEMLGADLAAVAPGSVEIELPFRADLTQQHGFIHAGIISTIADSACGYAAFTLMPPDAAVLTVEFKINLLAPAKGERFIARARVVRSGRTLSTCAADVVAVEQREERVVATMLATVMAVLDRPGLSG
jgi:uncharacterized protein (TIGR00369 family)